MQRLPRRRLGIADAGDEGDPRQVRQRRRKFFAALYLVEDFDRVIDHPERM
jgi:hypothetical protein